MPSTETPSAKGFRATPQVSWFPPLTHATEEWGSGSPARTPNHKPRPLLPSTANHGIHRQAHRACCKWQPSPPNRPPPRPQPLCSGPRAHHSHTTALAPQHGHPGSNHGSCPEAPTVQCEPRRLAPKTSRHNPRLRPPHEHTPTHAPSRSPQPLTRSMGTQPQPPAPFTYPAAHRSP